MLKLDTVFDTISRQEYALSSFSLGSNALWGTFPKPDIVRLTVEQSSNLPPKSTHQQMNLYTLIICVLMVFVQSCLNLLAFRCWYCGGIINIRCILSCDLHTCYYYQLSLYIAYSGSLESRFWILDSTQGKTGLCFVINFPVHDYWDNLPTRNLANSPNRHLSHRYCGLFSSTEE